MVAVRTAASESVNSSDDCVIGEGDAALLNVHHALHNAVRSSVLLIT
jgi:hypothetical protein